MFPQFHKVIVGLLAAFVLFAPAAARAEAAGAPLTAADARIYREAFRLLDKGRLGRALAQARRGTHPLPKKVLRWIYLYNSGSGASFDEIVAFSTQNPDWPFSGRLRRHAESIIPVKADPARAIAYFERHPPTSVAGRERHAEALAKAGQTARAAELVRRAWVDGEFRGRAGYRAQKRFLARHKKTIGPGDHFARAERLFWKHRVRDAVRFLGKMTRKDRAVATLWARLLRKRSSQKSIDQAMARVPASLRSHPGLRYARMRRDTRRERNAPARAVLHAPPAVLGDGNAWWVQRNIQVRRAIEERDYPEAYALARNHRLTSGIYFAEGEFVSGWIALRFLDQPQAALVHFERLHAGVKYPVSRARAAYWAGRASDALKQADKARGWYAKAARHPGTYYGQIAATHLSAGYAPPLAPAIDPATRARFEQSELVRVVRLLDEIGAPTIKGTFLRQVFRAAAGPSERALAAELALDLGDRKIAVHGSKKAAQKGDPIVVAGYPVLGLPPAGPAQPEDALVLALIRQESQFHTAAKSPAGARGLMQLMPRTARSEARKLRVRYQRARLTRDPTYNIRLGRAHLARLLREFGGHYALALAAYNAGSHRVVRWIAQSGDPRGPSVDIRDWVELIPFRETRNYVQRVLENLQVYRWRLGTARLVPAGPDRVYTRLRADNLGQFDGRPPSRPASGATGHNNVKPIIPPATCEQDPITGETDIC